MSEASAAPALQPRYDGRGGALAGLAFRTTLLTLVTLGIYRFWARTRMRRYLWSHVSLDGDRFEYTGTGGELFRGFLRVVAVFVPISILLGIADSLVVPGINGLQLPVLFVLAIIGRYYARRYRMTRTVWRGIRGNLVGGAGKYLGLSLLHLLHTVLTLGLTLPFYNLAVDSYLIGHTRFGSVEFVCRPLYGRLFRRYAGLWLGGLLLIGAAAGAAAVLRGDPEKLAVVSVLPLVAAVYFVFAFALYRVWEFCAVAEATSFGALAFKARPRVRRLLAAALVTAGMFLVALLVVGIGCSAVIAAIVFLTGASGTDAVVSLLPLLSIVLALLLFPAVQARFWTNALMTEVIDRISVAGEVDFATIAQNRDYVPTVGEGLFDVFDFAG